MGTLLAAYPREIGTKEENDNNMGTWWMSTNNRYVRKRV